MLITCEHGGNRIPAAYREHFEGQAALLGSHRGYDPGALVVARDFAGAFSAPLLFSTVSRLLVDLNRSIGHPRLFGEAIRSLPGEERQRIVSQYYQPYRLEVERLVGEAVAARGRVLHLSSHSFTPVLDGKLRAAEIGLLYDPARAGEVELCERWQAVLATRAPQLRVRRNYPYAGKGDGVTAWFRRRLSPDAYVGIELEVNQRLVLKRGRAWAMLRRLLVESLREAFASHLAIQPASASNEPPPPGALR